MCHTPQLVMKKTLFLILAIYTATCSICSAEDSAIDSMSQEEVMQVLKNRYNFTALEDTEEYNGMTPLMVAARRGDERCVKLLLKAGADVNAKGKYGSDHPLAYAAQAGNLEVVKLLLDAGANVNATGALESTALMSAAAGAHPEIVQCLIEHGAEVDAEDINGETPLFRVGAAASVNAIGKMINKLGTQSKGVNIPREANGARFKCIKILLEHGANPNVKPIEENTILMNLAALSQYVDSTKYLIEHGADIHAVGENGTTALLCAVYGNNPKAVKLLISKGADVNIRDNDGDSPLDVAIEKGYRECARILRAAGAR